MRIVNVRGAEIPVLGMGTYTIKGPGAAELIARALEMGYSYLDTAHMYENEDVVREAIRLADAEREDVYVVTKVHPNFVSKEKFLPSVEGSLKKLGLEKVDLLLIHWPNPEVSIEESIEGLLQAQEKGYTQHIGLSNFTIAQVQTALDMGANIVCNQVEYHCLINQKKLYTFLNEKDIALIAYSPLAVGKIMGNPVLQQIGQKYGKSEAQVALRWLIEQDKVIAIPRSSRVERLDSNLEIFDFWLSEEEKQAVNALNVPSQRFVDWEFSPDWD